MPVSGAASGGSQNLNVHVDGEANVPDEAPAGDAPGTVASGDASGAAHVGADLKPITDIAQKFTKKPDIGAQFGTQLDQNLIVGMGHVDVSGKVDVNGKGIDASVDAKGSFTLPFVGVPSLDKSVDDALARAKVTSTDSDQTSSKMSGMKGNFTDQHTRGVELSSQPDGSAGTAAMGATAAKDVQGGPAIWQTKGQASGSVAAFKATDSFDKKGAAGELQGGYDVAAAKLDGQVNGSVVVTAAGIDAKGGVSGSFTAVDATGKISYTTPSLTLAGVPVDGKVDVKAHASAGVEAHAQGEVAIEPAAGRVFVGGEVGASASAKIDATATAALEYKDKAGKEQTIASFTADGYVQAGAAAEAHARVGYDNGTITFDIGAGVSWGVGAGYDLKGSVNVKNLAGAVVDGIDNLTDGAITRAENTVTTVVDEAKTELKKLPGEIKDAVVRGADTIEDAVENVADDVGHSLKRLFSGPDPAMVDWAQAPANASPTDALASGLASSDPAARQAAIDGLRQLAKPERLTEARACLEALATQTDDKAKYTLGVKIGMALGKDAVDKIFQGGGPAVGALARYAQAGAKMASEVGDVPDQNSSDPAVRGQGVKKYLVDEGCPPFAGMDPAQFAADLKPELDVANQGQVLAKAARFHVSESDSTTVVHEFFRASQNGQLPSLLSSLEASGQLADVLAAGAKYNRPAIQDFLQKQAPGYLSALPK